jgi:hypothetical protein
MFGGLNDDEWAEWRNLLPVQYHDEPSKVEELERLTGRVPVYLDFFHRCTAPTWPLAVDLYLRDEDRGAGRIYMHLYEFSLSIFDSKKKTKKKDYLTLMSDALLERPSSVETIYDLFDQRYFFESEGIVKPISDLVRRIMAKILRKVKQEDYFESLTRAWVANGLKSPNPSVKGFAYEEYVLTKIVRRASFLSDKLEGVTEVDVKFFGDGPPSKKMLEELNDKFVLWWPKQWNHKHFDAIVRGPFTDGVTDRNKPKKQKTEKPQRLLVGPIQVTLQTPEQHRSSLEFWREDYKNWLLPSDDPARTDLIMFWVVPEPRDPASTLPVGPIAPFSQSVVVQKI